MTAASRYLLDEMVRRHVAPTMKQAGFTKSGRLFRLKAENGDYGLIQIHKYAIDPAVVVFYVTSMVVPAPYWDWLHFRRVMDVGIPDATGTMLQWPVMPPRAAAHDPDGNPHFQTRWAFRCDADSTECGRLLASALREDGIPRLKHLMDRANLLEACRDLPSQAIPGLTEVRRELVMLIEDGPVEEIRRLLPLLEEPPPSARFRMWIEERLAVREAAESNLGRAY